MFGIILNLAYATLLAVASPILLYQAIFKGKVRRGWMQKLTGRVQIPSSQSKRIWLHAVSVGEVNLLKNIVQKYQSAYPQTEIVISTTTQTGYDLAKSRYTNCSVVYFPMDFTWAVKRAIDRINPAALVLAELEIWPNLLRALQQQQIPVAIVNGRLSEKSFAGYQKIEKWIAPTLGKLDLVLIQNESYRNRFVALGCQVDCSIVTGSIKFDGAETNRNNSKTVALKNWMKIRETDQIFIAGSTQNGEEEIALDCYLEAVKSAPNLRLILVPRHAERFEEVAGMLDQRGVQFARRSHADSDPTTSSIILVDTIGELSSWWGVADVAFVGGSFGNRGGQNMLEPAAYGAAVSFGPNTKNFKDISELLIQNEAAVRVQTPEELTQFILNCIDRPEFAAQLGAKATELVKQQKGAIETSWQHLSELHQDSKLNLKRSKAA